ncbi:MAG TPA: substrate-binding domain-containing protein [Candidatus Methylacidiphilales bacterium]|nr:substrate-binding domain-containing protein [Candidatus Methylacidiphilales bacterium]
MKFRVLLVVISLVLSVLIGTALSRSGGTSGQAASAPGKGRRPVIGLSMDAVKEERWQRDRDYFVARAKELGADTRVLSANGNDTQQISDVESLLTAGVDVVVIIAHNGDAMAKGVKLAHESNVPVLAYDRLIRNCDLDLYVTFDNVKVGRVQAQYLVDKLAAAGKEKPKIVRLYGSRTDNNAFLFKQGQDEVLDPLIKAGKIEVIHEDWCDDWSPEAAKKIVNAAITKHGSDFDAILASADGIAGGGIQALREEGKTGKIMVTGQDADLSACLRIVNGEQTMTIYKPMKKLASLAADLAVNMATKRIVVAPDTLDNGKVQVPSIFLEVSAADKDSLRDTVIKDGVFTEEQLFGKK